MKNKVKMITIGFGLTAVMDIIIVLFINEPKAFVLGSLIGTGIALINVFLLEYVVNGATGKGNALLAILLEFLRLVIYILGAYIMYIISVYAAIGYAAGVVVLTLTLLIFYRKGTSDERR